MTSYIHASNRAHFSLRVRPPKLAGLLIEAKNELRGTVKDVVVLINEGVADLSPHTTFRSNKQPSTRSNQRQETHIERGIKNRYHLSGVRRSDGSRLLGSHAGDRTLDRWGTGPRYADRGGEAREKQRSSSDVGSKGRQIAAKSRVDSEALRLHRSLSTPLCRVCDLQEGKEEQLGGGERTITVITSRFLFSFSPPSKHGLGREPVASA